MSVVCGSNSLGNSLLVGRHKNQSPPLKIKKKKQTKKKD